MRVLLTQKKEDKNASTVDYCTLKILRRNYLENRIFSALVIKILKSQKKNNSIAIYY